MRTCRKPEVTVLIHISHSTVYHHPGGSKLVGACRHQSAPARGRKALGLLNVHDLSLFVAVRKMFGGRWGGPITHLGHPHGHGWPVDSQWSGRTLGREHGDAIEKASKRILELDQCVPNLGVSEKKGQSSAGRTEGNSHHTR